MADEIAERLVARELEIAARAVGADGLFALRVKVAPPGRLRDLGVDDERVRLGEHGAGAVAHADPQRPARGRLQPGDPHGRLAVGLDAGRQAVDRAVGVERQHAGQPRDRVAADVVGAHAQLERLADPAQGRQHRLPDVRRAGHEVDRRAAGDVAVDDGAERIDLHAHLEALLAHRRRAPAGAALRAIAEHQRQRIAFAQRLAHHVDADRLEPRPERAARVVLEQQLGAVRGARGAVVGRAGAVELRPAGVAREAQQEAQAALVVDAELAGGVGDAHRRHRAGDGLRIGLDADVAEHLGRVRQLADVGIADHRWGGLCKGAVDARRRGAAATGARRSAVGSGGANSRRSPCRVGGTKTRWNVIGALPNE